jgi:hypothetical protein
MKADHRKAPMAPGKRDRIARKRLFTHLTLLKDDGPDWRTLLQDVPEAWPLIRQDVDVDEPKEKVTLYPDRSVAKVFRAMGVGHQARMNRVLATWAGLHMQRL